MFLCDFSQSSLMSQRAQQPLRLLQMPSADNHFTHKHFFTLRLCYGRPFHSHFSLVASCLQSCLKWSRTSMNCLKLRAKTHHELSVYIPPPTTGRFIYWRCPIRQSPSLMQYLTQHTTWCSYVMQGDDDNEWRWQLLILGYHFDNIVIGVELLGSIVMLTTLVQNRQPPA